MSDKEEKEPERIFKVGPFEVWGKPKEEPTELQEAFSNLKEALINVIEPIVKPVLTRLEKILRRMGF